MLYQHIPVLTPGITASCSSVLPSFLAFVIILVLFHCFFMFGRMLFGQISKSSLLATFQKLDAVHSDQQRSTSLSPVQRLPICWLNLFLTFFLEEKIQTPKTGRSFVSVLFSVFLRGRFSKFFCFNRTSKIGTVEGVRPGLRKHSGPIRFTVSVTVCP